MEWMFWRSKRYNVRFLNKLEEKYGFFDLIVCINNRADRMDLERVFGVICTHENPNLFNDNSLFGNISYYYNYNKPFSYNFQDYENDKNKDTKLSIIKVWCGR